MPQFTVGSVPYVNAIPLVAAFELDPDPPVRVIYEVPSKLPALLESGDADAILVSSVDGLLHPGRRLVDGICVGSQGRVKSVRLFSRVLPAEIRRLALDQSSMTSNRLAQIVLSEQYGAHPIAHAESPNQAEMLAAYDACVLIGDVGMLAPTEGLHVLDLGQEFTAVTGKPFVWAAWIGGDRLTPELAEVLRKAGREFAVGKGSPPSDLAPLIDLTKDRSGWSEAMIRDYYLDVMVYRMDEPVLEGYRAFQQLLLKHGFEDCRHFPELL